MKKEEHQSLGYEFDFVGGTSNSYVFQTLHDVFYEVNFKPFFYFFNSDSIYSESTFEFGIIVLERPLLKLPSQDALIPITIAAIFTDFFDKIEQPSVVYICDSSDSKQLARQRKFNSWFSDFKQPNFFKIEGKLVDKNGEIIPSSLILKFNNPYFDQIIEEFQLIVEGYNIK